MFMAPVPGGVDGGAAYKDNEERVAAMIRSREKPAWQRGGDKAF
jgi:hypothetical protein